MRKSILYARTVELSQSRVIKLVGAASSTNLCVHITRTDSVPECI